MLHEWTLIDVEQGRYTEEWDYDGTAHGWPGLSISLRRLRGGLQDGVERISVMDGAFRWDILPTRGMSLHRAAIGDWTIGWNSPVRGPVHPAYVPLSEPGGLGWLAGFDELLVRCGLESNGAPEFDEETGRLKYPLHGRIGNLPARKVVVTLDTEARTVSVTGKVDESRFHFSKLELETTTTMRRGETRLGLRDVIRNRSASAAEAQLLYHVNFGEPLLDAGAQFVAPISKVVPRNEHAASGLAGWDRYGAPIPGTEEQVYFVELLASPQGRTCSMLKDAHATRAAALRHTLDPLRCYSLWKNPTATADGYVTGLEPGTNFPNPRSFEGERGRVIKLAPGGEAVLELDLEFTNQPERIAAIENEIKAIQGNTPIKVEAAPLPDWCA